MPVELDLGFHAGGFARFAPARALFLHQFLEARLVDGHGFAAQNIFGQIERKPKSVVETESDVTGQHLLVLCFEFCRGLFEQCESLLQSFIEAFLLGANDFTNALLFGAQFRIGVTHHRRNGFGDFMQEGLFQADQAPVARGAA